MKKAVKGMSVVVGIFFGIWLILFLLQIILPLVGVTSEFIVIANYLTAHLAHLKTLIIPTTALPYSIALYAVLGIALIMMIVLIIVAASRKRGKYAS